MSQFMEVIEWFDESGESMAHRYPEKGSGEIKMGAQLIVRENQAAIFFRDGKGLDVLGAGRHTLSTMNLPVITKVLSLPWGFTSPFRAEVYFTNMKVFTSMSGLVSIKNVSIVTSVAIVVVSGFAGSMLVILYIHRFRRRRRMNNNQH